MNSAPSNRPWPATAISCPMAAGSCGFSTLDTDQGRFCVMEFDESDDPGLMDRLTDAALPDTWWMRCADLGEAM